MKKHHPLHIIPAMLAVLLCTAGTTLPAYARTLPATHEKQQAATDRQQGTLKHWKAGQCVSEESIKEYGIHRCFTSEPISDAVFKRIYGKSFKKDCTVPRSQLRYLKVLHYNTDGKIQLGEIVCHKDISDDLTDIFRNLFKARYPIERMVLIDNYNADDEASMNANNTSCFNFRFVAGSKRLSKHSLGKAIDINPLYNPYVKKRADGTLIVSPKAGKRYADRSLDFKHKITHGDICHKEFIRHGFVWGGSWKTLKDYQHFEKR